MDPIRRSWNGSYTPVGDTKIADFLKRVQEHPDVRAVRIQERAPEHKHLIALARPGASVADLETTFDEMPKTRRFNRKPVEKS